MGIQKPINWKAQHDILLKQAHSREMEHIKVKKQRDDLLKALKKGPAPTYFAQFANFAEECMTNPSMTIYRGKFAGLSVFLRSCVDRSEEALQAIAKAESEG